MAIPGATYAEWLRSPALFSQVTNGDVLAAWGDDAPKSERVTALAFSADAQDEAVRQLTFMDQAMVVERHQLRGRFGPYIGKTVTIKGPRLGYGAGLDVIVLGAQDVLSTGMSAVTVLRRL